MGVLSKKSQISKLEKTADFHHAKGNKEWAKAKNEQGGEHFAFARVHFEKEKMLRKKAEDLK